MSTATPATTPSAKKNLGYKTFAIGKFGFERDEYFVHIHYPGGVQTMPVDAFLRALMRDGSARAVVSALSMILGGLLCGLANGIACALIRVAKVRPGGRRFGCVRELRGLLRRVLR